MAGLSTFAEEVLLDALLALNPQWIALFTSDPMDDNSGIEVTGGSYARQPITMVRTNSDINNTNAVTFPESTAAWGTVTHCTLMDSEVGGNQLVNEALVNPKSIGIGETMTFPIGSASFNLD
jgi:hypothetical protein